MTKCRGKGSGVGREEQRVEWSSSERKVMGAVENCLENCADIIVDV